MSELPIFNHQALGDITPRAGWLINRVHTIFAFPRDYLFVINSGLKTAWNNTRFLRYSHLNTLRTLLSIPKSMQQFNLEDYRVLQIDHSATATIMARLIFMRKPDINDTGALQDAPLFVRYPCLDKTLAREL